MQTEKPEVALYLTEKADRQDVQIMLMAKLWGFPWKTIAKATGKSVSQVGYRLKCMNIKTSEFRRGETDMAQRAIQFCREESKEYFNTIQSQIRKYLKDA